MMSLSLNVKVRFHILLITCITVFSIFSAICDRLNLCLSFAIWGVRLWMGVLSAAVAVSR
jgi:hypothetical protein